jgi:predicted phage-related endonuclease
MNDLLPTLQPGIVAHRPPDRETWLKLRQGNVTASQVGALVGIHDYVTALELWGAKSGWMTDGGQTAENAVLLRGELLEDDALELVRRQNPDWQIRPNIIGAGGVYLEDTVHRLGGTPDGFAITGLDGPAVIEIKTTDWLSFKDRWGGKDNPEPPLWIALQAMLNAHLAGCNHAYVVCMVVGRTLDLHLIRVDVLPELIEKLQRLTVEFWDRVERADPPSPDYERDGKIIAMMLPNDLGTEVDLSDDEDFVEACARYLELQAEAKQARDGMDTCSALIKHRMGEHGVARAQAFRVSNRRTERKGYVVAPTSYRKLSVREVGS